MTISPDTVVAHELAEAAARHIPAAHDVHVLRLEDGAQIGAFSGVAVADVSDGTTIALAVGSDLVEALATSPLGTLSLAAALQPAFDAVGQALGSTVGVARDVLAGELAAVLPEPAVTVLLGAHDASAALVVPQTLLLRQTAGGTGAAPVAAVPSAAAEPTRGIEMLHGVVMDVTVEIGRTRMAVRDLLSLAPGAVIELDRAAGSPADLLVNGRLIARGEVVVVDEDYALRITEILDASVAS